MNCVGSLNGATRRPAALPRGAPAQIAPITRKARAEEPLNRHRYRRDYPSRGGAEHIDRTHAEAIVLDGSGYLEWRRQTEELRDLGARHESQADRARREIDGGGAFRACFVGVDDQPPRRQPALLEVEVAHRAVYRGGTRIDEWQQPKEQVLRP